MNRKRPPPSSHLFTVRLWAEQLGGGESEIRCQVRHVRSGETRYFREWPALLTFLTLKLRQPDREEGGDR